MSVISFASSKGGAGKTTACVVLGTTLAEGLKVTIIDADPAGRSVRWSKKGPHSSNIQVIACPDEQSIQKVIKDAQASSDVVLVDLEGVASRLNTFVIAKSNLVVIPSGDEQQDAEDAIGTLNQVQLDGEMSGRSIPAKVLFTRTKAAVKSKIAKMLNAQMRRNVACFTVELCDRSAYSNLHNTGGGLLELPEGVGGVDKAIANARALAAEVIATIKESQMTQREAV